MERCILALTESGDTVLDPFVGTGTNVIAAAKHKRRGVGIDQSGKYIDLARNRLAQQQAGRLITRPMGKPLQRPRTGERVAMIPVESDAVE